jgi:hypothetical protein
MMIKILRVMYPIDSAARHGNGPHHEQQRVFCNISARLSAYLGDNRAATLSR